MNAAEPAPALDAERRHETPRAAGTAGLDQAAPDADTFLLARALGFSFLFVFAVRAAAVFMLLASTIGLRTGFLPRWLVIAGYLCGFVFLLSVTYVEWLILVLPAWVSAVSIVILRAGTPRPGSDAR